jgi:hypothetical protein
LDGQGKQPRILQVETQLVAARSQVSHRFPLPIHRVPKAVTSNDDRLIPSITGDPITFSSQELNPYISIGRIRVDSYPFNIAQLD